MTDTTPARVYRVSLRPSPTGTGSGIFAAFTSRPAPSTDRVLWEGSANGIDNAIQKAAASPEGSKVPELVQYARERLPLTSLDQRPFPGF